ncbi:MAG: hypothetical protein IPM45_04085 [Acidimicrobiales bacterium]|nr:hypothetical protein [Acidimicrobiales bacterium]
MSVATRPRRRAWHPRLVRVHPAQQTLWPAPPWGCFARYASELGGYQIGGLDPADLALTPADIDTRPDPTTTTAASPAEVTPL